MKVIKVLNGVISKDAQPAFSAPLDITLGQAEFALIGYDTDYLRMVTVNFLPITSM